MQREGVSVNLTHRIMGQITRQGDVPFKQFNATYIDRSVPNRGSEKASRIDLGLEIAKLHCPEGHSLSLCEIAAFCGCSYQHISAIETKALQKIFARLSPDEVIEMQDMLHWLHNRE